MLLYIYSNIMEEIMMLNFVQLSARRMEIIDEITEIKSMRKGVLNAKYQKAMSCSPENLMRIYRGRDVI